MCKYYIYAAITISWHKHFHCCWIRPLVSFMYTSFALLFAIFFAMTWRCIDAIESTFVFSCILCWLLLILLCLQSKDILSIAPNLRVVKSARATRAAQEKPKSIAWVMLSSVHLLCLGNLLYCINNSFIWLILLYLDCPRLVSLLCATILLTLTLMLCFIKYMFILTHLSQCC